MVFPYTQTSAIEIVRDTNWLKTNAEKYLQYVKDSLIKPGNDHLFEIMADVLLNRNEEGLALVSDKLQLLQKSNFPHYNKTIYSILYGYFRQKIQSTENSYYYAVQTAFTGVNPTITDRQMMYKEQKWPDSVDINNFVMNFATNNETKLASSILEDVKALNRQDKAFTTEEMGMILIEIASPKIAGSIEKEQNKFANDQLAIIKKEKANHEETDVAKLVDKEMNRAYPENEPGAAIVIMRGDSIIMNKGYGLADMNTKTKITPSTNFNIGSISKMFTATAILLLTEKGKLNLQDPIIKYLPDVNPRIGNKITIYHLLTHTSGLPHSIPTKDSSKSFSVMDRDTYNLDKNIDSLDFEPGTRFGYSNIGYRWLALIVENLSGSGFGDFVRKNILLKAGMKNSYEMNRDAPIINFAHAYKKAGNGFAEYDYGEGEQFSTLGDGGLVSSTNDLISWEKALRSNKVLSKKSFEESITPFINSELDVPGSSYGFGWFIQKSPDGGPTIYSHSGGNSGFVSYLFRIPEKNIMVAYLCNRNDRLFDVGYLTQSFLRKAGWY